VRENFTAERDLYLAETANFLAAIRGEEPALAPARDGLQGVRLVSAVLTSARNFGQPVSVLPG